MANASAKVYAAIAAVLSNELDMLTPEGVLKADLTPVEFGSGTGEYEISKWFSDERSLSASATENLDLAGGLTDALGVTITFTAIKAILVLADKDNTNDVVVGGAGANTFLGVFADATDKVNVKPGGMFLWCAPETGATVTASTGDILLVANSAGSTSVTYKIVILGIG